LLILPGNLYFSMVLFLGVLTDCCARVPVRTINPTNVKTTMMGKLLRMFALRGCPIRRLYFVS
jgi:hypothetical protein